MIKRKDLYRPFPLGGGDFMSLGPPLAKAPKALASRKPRPRAFVTLLDLHETLWWDKATEGYRNPWRRI